MLVIYHGVDLDGYACAAIINFYLGGHESLKFHPINHGEPFPYYKIDKGEKVFILDFPPPAPGEGWEDLLAITEDIIWIDHHESALKKFEEIEIEGSRSLTTPAACELVWDYFFDVKTPESIKMIGDHDSWQHQIHHSDAFCLGMLAKDWIEDPRSEGWKSLLSNALKGNEEGIKTTISKGHTIQQYCKKSHAAYVKAVSYEMQWLGYRCLVANRGLTGSYLFDSLWDKDKHDLMIAYVYEGDHYIVSIYTTKTDQVKANDIAIAHGGGGHPGAAGFTCKELPWTILSDEEMNLPGALK